MSDQLLLGIIGAATTVIVAAIGVVGVVLARKANDLDVKVDGRLTQLLESIRAEGVTNASLAGSEGRAEGKATEQQDQRDRDAR